MADRLPLGDFAAKIKAKYPQYKDVNDTTLVEQMLKKYPQYSEQVDWPLKKKEDSGQDSESGAQTSTEPLRTFQAPDVPDINVGDIGSSLRKPATFGDITQAADQRLSEQEAAQANVQQQMPYLQEDPYRGLIPSPLAGEGVDNYIAQRNQEIAAQNAQSERLSEQIRAWQQAHPNEKINIPELNPQTAQAGVIEQGEDLTNWQSVKNSFSNTVNDLRGWDDRLSLLSADVWENILGKEAAKGWYDWGFGFGLGGRDIDEVRKEAYEELDRLSGRMKKTKGILDSAEKGDLLGVLAGGINAVLSVGSTALTSGPYGVGLFTDMTARSIEEYNREKAKNLGISVPELYETGQADFGLPALLGTIGGGLERIGLKGVQKSMMSKLSGPTAKMAAKFFMNNSQEGLTEYLQEGLSAANEAAANPDASIESIAKAVGDKLTSRDAFESFAQGFVGSAGAAGAGRIARNITSPELRDQANENVAAIEILEQELQNQEISAETRSAISNEIRRNTSELVNIAEQDAEVESMLTPEQEQAISPLMERLDNIQAAMNDPNISDETKKMFEPALKSVTDQIDSIIKEATKPKQESRTAAEVDSSDYSSETLSLIDEKNQRIQDITIELAKLDREGINDPSVRLPLVEERRSLQDEINSIEPDAIRETPTDETTTETIEETPAEPVETTDTAAETMVTEPTQETVLEQGQTDIDGDAVTEPSEAVQVSDEANPQRAAKTLQDSYNRLTEGMTPEQIDSDPDLVRMRDRIGQLSETQENVTPSETTTAETTTEQTDVDTTVEPVTETTTEQVQEAVPETEVEQQTQEETSNAVQKRSAKKIPLGQPSGDSKEVGKGVREQTPDKGKDGTEKVEVGEQEIKPVTINDVPKKKGEAKQITVAPDVQAKITISESIDGEDMYVVQMERDGVLIEDNNGDTDFEFADAEEAVKYINQKQRGFKLASKKPTVQPKAKKEIDTGDLNTPMHLELADHNIGYETDSDGKYQIIETNSNTPIGPKFDTKSQMEEYWDNNSSRITGVGLTSAIEQGKRGTQILAQARKPGKATERLTPAKQTVSGKPKAIGKMISDLSEKLGATIIYAKPRSRGAAGTYEPSNALTTIRNAGDIDTVAHEIGHFADDSFDLLGTAPASVKPELKWFYDRGGSNPPDGLTKKQRQEYLDREGVGEFVRAYIVNPAEAKRIAPELYKHFESTLPSEALDAIKEFSKDALDFYNAPAGDMMASNIELTPLPDKKGFMSWIKTRSKDPDKLVFDWRDDLTAKIFDGLHMATKAYDFAAKVSGVGNLIGSSRFEIVARTFAGINGKMESIFSKGMIDFEGKLFKSKSGKPMTVKWLFEPLAADTVTDVENASHDVIKYLIAQRTIEYANKFGRRTGLTGVGGGLMDDVDVAQSYMKDFESMKQQMPGYAANIEEAASRYREYADATLRYYRDSGRISQEQYQAIKDGNEMYVSLARINETAPEQESSAFVSKGPRARISAVREALRQAKGGTSKIKNPYLSLLENANNMIHEADRNAVMQEFVKPLRSDRRMGEGRVQNLAQIGRQVRKGEENTVKVFVDGKEEVWQLAPDVFRSIKSMDSDPMNAAMKILSAPAKAIRFTVTTVPPFAARNLVRDTVSRLILSNNNSKLFDMAYSREDKRLFEIYGGSQAGHYLTSRKSYYDMMKQSMGEVAKKSVVLDPRKISRLGHRYMDFLQKAENLNRIAEFNAAYEKAKKEGLNDREAGMYAAYQSRDLIDFAVAGHWIRVINQVIPFTNAAVQGLRRAGRHLKDKPLEFAYRTAIYTVIPTLIERAMVYATGDEDEYEQLPYWQRDMYWNFKIPLLTDKWISIPKPFELGLAASTVSRGISAAQGKDNAFDGYFKSVVDMLVPVDEQIIAGGYKPLIEVMANKDFFRDKPIIPTYEENLKLSNREGTKYASSLGKMLSEAFGFVGTEVDPRNVDHVVKGFFSSYGDYAIRLSNWIGGNEYSRPFNIGEMSSFVKERPIANSKDVLEVYELAERNGKATSAPVRRLKKMVREFYNANTIKQRDEVSDRIYRYSQKLRKDLEALDRRDKK